MDLNMNSLSMHLRTLFIKHWNKLKSVDLPRSNSSPFSMSSSLQISGTQTPQLSGKACIKIIESMEKMDV